MTAADSHHKKSQVKNKFPLSLKKNGIQNDPGTMISESHTARRTVQRYKKGERGTEGKGGGRRGRRNRISELQGISVAPVPAEEEAEVQRVKSLVQSVTADRD